MATAQQEDVLQPKNTRLHEKANGWVAVSVSFLTSLVEWFVVMVMWNWFVAPLGLPRLGYWQSVGLSMLVSLVRSRSDDGAKLDEVTTWYKLHRRTFYSLGLSVLYLLFGWLAHLLTHKP